MMSSPKPRRLEALRARMALLPLILIGLLSALLFGGLVGLGAGIFALLLIVPFFVLGLLLFTQSFGSFRFGGEGVFWLVTGVALLTALADAVSPIRTRGLMTMALLGLSIYGFRGMFVFATNSWLGKLLVAAFLMFFALGAASSMRAGHIHWYPFFYQIGYDLKLPIMLLAGFCVTLGEKGEQRFWLVVKIMLAVCLAALAVELAAPSVHHLIARNATSGGHGNPLVPGLPLTTGPFVHPSVLASMAALFLCCVFARWLSGQGTRAGNIILCGGFLMVLLVSGQRQEFLDAMVACAILLFSARMKPKIASVLIALLGLAVVAGAVLLLLGPDNRADLASQWGLAPSYSALATPRTVFYVDAIHLANSYFPLGTGFGKFAGEAARMFDRSVYETLGYGARYWWYRQDLYLLDTYWPNLFAEAGWIGGGVVLMLGVLMTLYALQRAWTVREPRERLLWRLAFVGHFLALSGSMTAPIYGDPNAVALPFLFFGIAFSYSLKLRRAEAAALAAKRNAEYGPAATAAATPAVTVPRAA